MIIKWKIEKKRGNLRPSLFYEIALTDYEKELAVPKVFMESTIPEIPDSHQKHCPPGVNERASSWQPAGFHSLDTPYFKDGELSNVIRLPLREDNAYPEVRDSFMNLMEKFEKALGDTYAQKPFVVENELDTSDATKRLIAAGITASRMLDFAGIGEAV